MKLGRVFRASVAISLRTGVSVLMTLVTFVPAKQATEVVVNCALASEIWKETHP